MPEQLLKKFSIDVQEKLFETQHTGSTLAVFQTHPFGKLMTLDGEIIISEQDSFFYHEMITHPALFSHPHPQKIAVIGHYAGIINEILKHTEVSQVICVQDNPAYDAVIDQFFADLNKASKDPRVTRHSLTAAAWLAQNSDKFDIIIDARSAETTGSRQENFNSALADIGMLVKSCPSLLLHFDTLKNELLHIQRAGFTDWQLLNFPQPSYTHGMRSALLGLKHPGMKRIAEKKIFNRLFTTRYYNLDTHKAALMLPEFMKELEVPL